MELLQQPGSGSVVLSLLGGLLLFGLVLLAAWFCTRWLGGYYRARGAQGAAAAPPGEAYRCWSAPPSARTAP